MNARIAREMAAQIANLAELVAVFTAHYGSGYRMTEDSPAHAWELYQRIMTLQTNIANHLGQDALASPKFSRPGEWWKRQDVPDVAIINELAQDVFHLVARCAYHEALAHEAGHTDTAFVLERSIAGILHPTTRKSELTHSVL